MSNFLILLKIQFYGLFGINKALHSKNSAERKKIVRTAVLFVFAALMFAGLSAFYNYMFASVLRMAGMDISGLIGVMFAVSGVLILINTIYKTNGTVLGFKDYDTVMSLPVKKTQVILSKIFFVYLLDFMFAFVAMVPSGIIYAVYSSPAPVFYPLYFIALFFVPLIPMIIGLFLGALVTYIASRFRKTNFIAIVLYIVFIVAVMVFSYTDPQSEQYLSLITSLNKIYPLTGFFIAATVGGAAGKFLIFIAVSVAVAVIGVYVLGIGFEQINTAVLTKKTGAKYDLKKGGQKSAVKTLFFKEIKKFFSLPMYVMNAGIGGVLALLLGVYVLGFGGGYADLFGALAASFPVTFYIIPAGLCLLLTMTSSTTSAVSLEGKNMWILKSSPVTAGEVLISKLMVNNVIILPAGLISAVFIGVFMSAGLAYYAFAAVCIISAVTFSSAIGLYINLARVRLDWDSEIQVIKQSAAVLIHMLISFVYTTAVIAGVYFLYQWAGGLGIAAVAVLLVFVSAAAHYLLITHGAALYDRISE